MKKCPSCSRAYSDTVTQCPSCGIELNEGSSSYGANSASNSQERNNVETHTQKVVDSGEEKKKNGVDGWKISSAILLMLALLFAGLYAFQLSEYGDIELKYNKKNKEYNALDTEYVRLDAEYEQLKTEYIQLEKEREEQDQAYDKLNKAYEQQNSKLESYDLEGRYIIDVTAVYNGTEEYKCLSGGRLLSLIPTLTTFSKQSLNCICFEWDIRDFTKSWDDFLYVDVITPDGNIFLPKSENNNHTWKIDVSDTIGDEHGRRAWFQEGTWKSGTYRIIFYQGSKAIDSFEVKVT